MNATTFNTHETPNGGWAFHQPQSNWSVPNPVSQTHDSAVTLIIKHRLANPAMTATYRLKTDFNGVSDELQNFTRARLGIPLSTAPKTQASRWLAGNLGAVAVGAKTLILWLGKGGKPVEAAEAERRASICANCPMNEKGDWTRWFTNPLSELIRAQLRTRDEMKLSTVNDERLHVCTVCACPLKLKVWTPLPDIRENMSADVQSKLPDHCWIK